MAFLALCGTREGLVEVALPHHTGSQVDAATRRSLAQLPAAYEPGPWRPRAEIQGASRESRPRPIERGG